MKKLLLLILIPFTFLSAQDYIFKPATGLFMSVGVGPRIPISQFSENQNIGIGIDLELAYTNSNVLPIFVFGQFGYMNFPGLQSFYNSSDYSSLTTNIFVLHGGVRYYLPPLIDDMVLLMPVFEVSASLGYLEKGHVFKIDSGLTNFTENNVKTGLKLAAGFSMFLMDVMASYNYLQNNQFIALDLKVRIPIFVEFLREGKMTFNNLLVEVKDFIAVVTINRPEKLNALNAETFSELKTLFSSIKTDDNVYVVIVTGAGEKAFVAGADIAELSKQDGLSGKEFSETGQEVFNLIENLGKPVIAAVNGFALGGGCEFSLACHIRVASERAKFGQPEVNLGIIPGYGGTQRLANIINPGRAAEYILTGDMIEAEEALRIGLVSKVYPHDELMAKAWEIASRIASKGQTAVRLSLQAIQKSNEISEAEGQAYEAAMFGVCCSTEDFKEGTQAFLEKRKPDFKN